MNRFCQGRHAKPEGIYEMFGEYFDKNQVDVRNELFAWIDERLTEIEDNIRIVLRHKNLSMESWLNWIVDLKCPADELVIYCLAKKYYKHVVIYTATYSWSTLAKHCTYTKEEIRDKYQIQLVHRGPYKYAELWLIGLPRSQSNPAADIATSPPKEELKNESGDAPSSTKLTTKQNTTVTNTEKPSVKYKILQCVISASNIIPSVRKHNTRESNRRNSRKSTKSLRSSRRSINYAKLNDGLDPFTPPSPKRQRKYSYRPQKDGPSEQRLTAHANTEGKTLDLEEIMDTTLDDENHSMEIDEHQVKNGQSQSNLVEVTVMDGGKNPELDTHMNGVTLDNNLTTPTLHAQSPSESTADSNMNIAPSSNSGMTDTPMDGITEYAETMIPPSVSTHTADTTPLTKPSCERNNMSLDGVTTSNNRIVSSNSVSPEMSNIERSVTSMDGVTSLPPLPLHTENNSILNKKHDINITLDGVTAPQQENLPDVSLRSPNLNLESIDEMVANNEFPEKRLLLDGVTLSKQTNTMKDM